MSMRTHFSIFMLLLFGCAACGCKGGKGTSASTKQSAVEALGITPPEIPWEEMSEADKEFYMVGKVNPIMQELFARHDLEAYDGFSCEHCHGEEMRELKFKMPAPSMYVVPKEGTRAYQGMELTFPEMVAFMKETVTPAMATLLGQPEISCATCHPSAKPKKKKRRKR